MNTPPSLCRRLRILFQQKPPAATTVKASPGDKDIQNLVESVTPSLCRLRILFQQKPPAATTVEASPGDKDIHNLVKSLKNSSSGLFHSKRFVYKNTVRRLAKDGRSSHIHDILNRQKLHPGIKNEHFTAHLIFLYGQAKMLDHALQLFDEMPDLNCPRTLFSFNALLSACFPSKNFDKVIELFRELPRKHSIKPNILSYTAVIRASCEIGSLDAALSFFEEMKENDIEPNAVTFNILLAALYRGGRFPEAENLWSLMEEKKIVPDLRCYKSRLRGMVNQKRLSEAVDIFKEMKEKGLKPNTFTFNSLIKGFADEGDLEEVKKWYAAMIESSCTPDVQTFTTAIPFACDNNDTDFAFELCKRSVGLRKLPSEIKQRVIDELVEQSRVEEAKELLELDKSKSGLVLTKL